MGLSFSSFHQNFLILVVIKSIKASNMLHIDIVFTGIACRTALIKTSQLASNKKFSFHPLNFLMTLSLILYLKTYCFDSKVFSNDFFSIWYSHDTVDIVSLGLRYQLCICNDRFLCIYNLAWESLIPKQNTFYFHSSLWSIFKEEKAIIREKNIGDIRCILISLFLPS